VYLGTLDPSRNIEILFDMLSRVRRELPEALLVLVGNSEDQSHIRWLKAQAEEVGVADHVFWTGWLPMREAWRYVRIAEVGLSPIPRGALLDVSSPTKLPEYLALGIPVVCSDNPDQRSIIASTGAGRCVPYTAEAFSSAVLEVLGATVEERRVMVASGCEYVRRYRAYDNIARLVATKYKEITKTCEEEC
jgi:glycosyltransferase involved in cell wall biosynthesis